MTVTFTAPDISHQPTKCSDTSQNWKQLNTNEIHTKCFGFTGNYSPAILQVKLSYLGRILTPCGTPKKKFQLKLY